MTEAIEKIFESPVYGLGQADKSTQLLQAMSELNEHHLANCQPYAAILAAQGFKKARLLSDFPFLPVRLFKQHFFESISHEDRFKVLTSSGTTGQAVSRISLDRTTSNLQTNALVRIMQSFLGKERLPMLIIDHPGVILDRNSFSARGAGILGMSNFGRRPQYFLNNGNLTLNLSGVNGFLQEAGEKPILLFGFTFMVWEFLVRELERTGQQLNIPNGILVHSGGWKKLQDQAVDNISFKRRLKAVTGIQQVHNFYGMVEQVGSIFVECEHGQLHVPAFAEVIVRRPTDWTPVAIGEEGVIQVLSCLPRSYPGHSLLTEDLGTLTGEDNCPCGRKGRTFKVKGRMQQAEVRGCSDTFGQSN